MNARLQGQITIWVAVAALAGGAYGLFVFLQGDAGGSSSECTKKRREIIAACKPECDKDPGNLLAAHDQARPGEDPGCMDRCAVKNFGTTMPVCAQRR